MCLCLAWARAKLFRGGARVKPRLCHVTSGTRMGELSHTHREIDSRGGRFRAVCGSLRLTPTNGGNKDFSVHA